ncbi:MAG TPA: hypothetical protein VM487_25460 [Phycisphaerae bacterium]|nr:hypothetical protein [Phycisphaerae bacterium]
MVVEYGSLDVRPYQLLCCFCRLGRQGSEEYYFEERLQAVAAAVRGDPSLPITVHCNVDTNYRYQNPGRGYDTPEGKLFNDKRDLDILHLLGLVPGSTRPAFELFCRVFKDIPTCRGICAYDKATSEAWFGCRLADSGNYERGHTMGVEALIPGRPASAKAGAKAASVSEFFAAKCLRIRPHHLMCMTCFHAGKKHIAPIEQDNLCEAIEVIRETPDIPVTLIPGPCMICPPCSSYHEPTGLCVSGSGMALRDQKKDLDVLQLLGMAYGDTMAAQDLLARLYAAVRSTRQICGYGDGKIRAPEWRICGGPNGNPSYVRGRECGMNVPGIHPDTDGRIDCQ